MPTSAARHRNRFWLVMIPLSFLIAVWFQGALNSGAPLKGDANQYYCMILAYQKHQVVSLDCHAGEPSPSMFREPMIAWAMAPALSAIPDDWDISSCARQETEACRTVRKTLGYASIVMVMAAFSIVVATVWGLTKSHAATGLSALAASSMTGLMQTGLLLQTEVLAMLLLTSATALGVFAARRTSWPAIVLWALSGIALGLCILTKAVFLFFLPVVLMAAAFFAWRRNRTVAAGLALQVFMALMVVAPWIARNVAHFDRYALTDRGSAVIALRAGYSDISWDEYWAGYIAFNPYLKSRNAQYGWVDPDLMVPFDRSHPGSVFNRIFVNHDFPWPTQPSQSLAEKQKLGLGYMAEHLGMAISMTPLLIYRGMFQQTDYQLLQDTAYTSQRTAQFTAQFTALSAFIRLSQIPNILLVPAFIAALVLVCRLRHTDLLILALPAVFSIGIHAAATPYIPRFNLPLTGIMIVFIAVAACRAWEKRSTTRRREADAG